MQSNKKPQNTDKSNCMYGCCINSISQWCKNNRTVRACVERKWFRNTIILTSLVFFLTLFWLLKPVSWYVVNEDNEYINLHSRDNTALVIVGSWKNAQDTLTSVYSASTISEKLSTIKGKVIWLVDGDDDNSPYTAQLMKTKYNMNIDIYFAPKALWKSLFKEESENSEPLSIIIKDGKEINRIKGVQKWLSFEGLDILNKSFNSKMSLI